jgi:hypothetical protein
MSHSKAKDARMAVEPLKRFVSAANPGNCIVYFDTIPGLHRYVEVPCEASDREVYFLLLKDLARAYDNQVGGDLFRDFASLSDK